MHIENIRRILIIQTAFIGDVVLAEPLARAAKLGFTEAEVHFLTTPSTANLLENNPFIDRILRYDKRYQQKGLRRFLEWSKRLRSMKYDLALIPHRSFRSAFLAWGAQIPIRVGFRRSAGWRFFTHKINYQSSKHEIERNLALLKPFNLTLDEKTPKIFPNSNDIELVDSFLSENELNGCPLVALAPGSHWISKRWPEEHFVVLAEKLLKEDYKIILIGGQEDELLCKGISQKVGVYCYSAASILNLRQSVELLRRCQLLISNDSAPTHLGVAARIRIVTIFGSTAPVFGFYPFGNTNGLIEAELPCRPCSDHGRRKCPIGTLECLVSISPHQVYHEILRYISPRIATE